MSRLLILFIGSVLSFIILLSNATGVPQVVTGAPGESGFSCNACHSGGNFNTEISVQLLQNNQPVQNYTPGESYQLRVSVTGDNNPKAFGFQLVCLKDENNSDLGVWSALGPNVRTRTMLNRVYLQQSNPRVDGIFTCNWSAPSQDVGDISFYFSGLAVNLNGDITGDQHDISSFRLSSGTSSSDDMVMNERFSSFIYPNPGNDKLWLRGLGKYKFEFYNLQGQLCMNGIFENEKLLDTNNLVKGTYIIRLSDTTVITRHKLLKWVKI